MAGGWVNARNTAAPKAFVSGTLCMVVGAGWCPERKWSSSAMMPQKRRKMLYGTTKGNVERKLVFDTTEAMLVGGPTHDFQRSRH